MRSIMVRAEGHLHTLHTLNLKSIYVHRCIASVFFTLHNGYVYKDLKLPYAAYQRMQVWFMSVLAWVLLAYGNFGQRMQQRMQIGFYDSFIVVFVILSCCIWRFQKYGASYFIVVYFCFGKYALICIRCTQRCSRIYVLWVHRIRMWLLGFSYLYSVYPVNLENICVYR